MAKKVAQNWLLRRLIGRGGSILLVLLCLSLVWLVLPAEATSISQPNHSNFYDLSYGDRPYQFLTADPYLYLDTGLDSVGFFMSATENTNVKVHLEYYCDRLSTLYGDMSASYVTVSDFNWYLFDDFYNSNNCLHEPIHIRFINLEAENDLVAENLTIYGTAYNSFAGDTFDENAYNAGTPISLVDLAFTININEFSETSGLTFTNPVGGGESIYDFSHWVVAINSDKPDSYLWIKFNNFDGVNGDYYEEALRLVGVGIGAYQVPKMTLLNIIPNTWKATAYLTNADKSKVYAVSPEITFTIIDPADIPPDCAGGGWVGNQFCEVLVWLFDPGSYSLNKFSTLADDIKNKPPMGYFLAIKNALSGVGGEAEPAFMLEGIESLDPFFSPLKTGLAFILWLIFGVWLYNRVKHLEI